MWGLRSLGRGLADLRAHPWRALLSGISLCIGVLAVVAVSTVGVITAEVFIASAEQVNGRLPTWSATYHPAAAGPAEIRRALSAAAPITDTGGAVALLATGQTTAGMGHPSQAQRGEPLRRQLVTLVAGDLHKVRRLPILAGRWFDTNADVPVGVVVNQAAANLWGTPGTTVSMALDPHQPPLTAMITGVIADGFAEPTVLASLIAAATAKPGILANMNIEILLHHQSADQRSLNLVAQRIAATTGGTLKDPLRRADAVDALLANLRLQKLAFLSLALLTLVISALGILNIGLASVQERARELVIRRAIGATRTDILAQVLLSAAFIGIIAAAAAIGLAAVGVQLWVPSQIPPVSAITPPALPWTAILWAIAAATATTLLGAAAPAIVAARVDVAAALRD